MTNNADWLAAGERLEAIAPDLIALHKAGKHDEAGALLHAHGLSITFVEPPEDPAPTVLTDQQERAINTALDAIRSDTA